MNPFIVIACGMAGGILFFLASDIIRYTYTKKNKKGKDNDNQ